jgi:heptaprenyl diphosphate synthase
MTCSAADQAELARVRRNIFLALFAALAVALHTLEVLLPTPVPWFRLGLANVLTLVALFLYGGRAAWTVSLVRVGLGSLLLGRIFSPGFWLALAGVIVATGMMIAAWHWGRRWLGPIGVSMLGAAGHAVGQLTVAWALLVRHAGIWQIFPVFLLVAVITGILTGWVAAVLLEHLQQYEPFRKIEQET